MTEMTTEQIKPTIVLKEGAGTGDPGCECAGQCSRRLLRERGILQVPKLTEEEKKAWSCPPTASPLIWEMMVYTNDRHPAWRAELADADLLLQIGQSRGPDELEARRAYRMADWAIRETLPFAYEELGAVCLQLALETDGNALIEAAKQLKALKPITDEGSARAARAALAALAARAALDALADPGTAGDDARCRFRRRRNGRPHLKKLGKNHLAARPTP